MKRYVVISAFFVLEMFVLIIALEQRASAYVDPGSGLLAYQIGGSIFAGAYFMMRRRLHRLFRIVRCRQESASQENQIAVSEDSSGDPRR